MEMSGIVAGKAEQRHGGGVRRGGPTGRARAEFFMRMQGMDAVGRGRSHGC